MSVKTRLSIMMFLQFFIWGAWYVSVTGFLNQMGMSGVTGAVYTIGPLAAIVAPFFLGMIADRFFAAERVLAVLHLLGGGLMIAVPTTAAAFALEPAPEDASLFYTLVLHDLPAFTTPLVLLLFGHMLCYMPTLGLTTSLSLRHLETPEKEFPRIRVLGTIGWIAGNVAVSQLPGKDASAGQFYLAGGAALLLGLFSLALPHTRPTLEGKQTRFGQIVGIDSLRLLKKPSYAVFLVCSFLICIPLAGYYAQGRNFVAASGGLLYESATLTMSFGQISEIFFMLVMPLFFARLGVKKMLAIGMLAWVARYGLFAIAAEDQIFWMIFLGVLLHGICYDFFFVTGMIYVDQVAPADIRNQAQGLLVLVTQGLGLGLGAKLFFVHVGSHTHDGVLDWYSIWMSSALFAAIILVLFYVSFRNASSSSTTAAST